MTFFLCKLWPYLAGGLIGWLLAGWFARRLKHCEAPVERVVEKEVVKVVDNPDHVALIGKLEGENSKISSLMSTISDYESSDTRVIEKEIEKVVEVDNPELLARIKKLEEENSQISGLQGQIKDLESTRSTGSTEVEKIVDNPNHVRKISLLEDELAMLKASQKADVEAPKAAVITKDTTSSNQKKPDAAPSSNADVSAAKAAGFKIKQRNGEDDFTVVEGIGPKINGLIHAAGVHTYAELGETLVEDIQKILDDAGPRYKLAKPGTWPAQSEMAATNRWDTLKAWQDELDGGK